MRPRPVAGKGHQDALQDRENTRTTDCLIEMQKNTFEMIEKFTLADLRSHQDHHLFFWVDDRDGGQACKTRCLLHHMSWKCVARTAL